METATQPRYIHIYMEANPNPASLKFVANHFLLPDGADHYYESADQAGDSPLAQMLFGLPFVDKVFIMSNFVTVTKKDEYDWNEIGKVVREALQDYLAQGKVVMNSTPEAASFAPSESDTETVAKIKGILDEYIRPAVESDGGAINFHSFNEESGLVKVQLRGSCSGCPSSTVTLKAGIENLLTRMVPQVKTVEAEGV